MDKPDRLSILETAQLIWCDWQRTPPATNWEMDRRSMMFHIELAETYLAHLRAALAEFVATKPDFDQSIILLEMTQDAARYASNNDMIIREHLERVSSANKPLGPI